MANEPPTTWHGFAGVERSAELGGPTADDAVAQAGSAPLQVSLSVSPDADGGARAVVMASGEIDINSVELLRAAALGIAVAAAPYPYGQSVRLVLDWEGVSFLDCSGVRLLEELHARGVEHGWSLRWIPPSARGPVRLLRLAADQGWLARPLAHQLAVKPRAVFLAAAAANGQ